MIDSSLSRDAAAGAAGVRYDTDGFRQAVAEIGRRAGDGQPVLVLFGGGADDVGREALAALTEHTKRNVHQIDLAPLATDRFRELQGNLREVFDNTNDGASILYFDNGDALFSVVEMEAEAEGLDDDALTPLDYFCERAKRFKGIVILRVREADHLARAREFSPDLVVRW